MGSPLCCLCSLGLSSANALACLHEGTVPTNYPFAPLLVAASFPCWRPVLRGARRTMLRTQLPSAKRLGRCCSSIAVAGLGQRQRGR